MRKITGIAFILISILLLCGCNPAAVLFELIEPYGNEHLSDTELVIENEYLKLEMDCETTQFALTDKQNNTIWYSNPPDADNDASAIAVIKERMQSQLIISYGQMAGTVTEVNNNTLSILGGSYQWEVIDKNSIKVSYTIGKVERVYIVPGALSDERFMAYYELMDTDQQNMLNNYFRIISLDRLRPTDNKDELVARYPQLEDGERVFELREELQGHIMERLETAFKEQGYTYEDFLADRRDKDSAESELPVFNVSIIYTLDGPDFVVTVPLEEIEYRHSYPPLTMSVLPYFGAAGPDTDGFMFVPDASGALIYNNNGKFNQQQYNISLYGFDTAIKREAILNENFAYMPLFGVSRGDDAFICIIEDGDERSNIEADVSGRTNSYNTVGVKYTIVNWDDADISKANTIAKVFDRTRQTGNLQQRYRFLSSPGYVDMAVAYRGYLMDRYPALVRSDEPELPVVLGLIGAIDKTENIFGIPMSRPFPLTTYSEAADIIKDFSNAGINNLRANYVGWFNGGVLHDAPGKLNLISVLGGKRGFTDLVQAAENTGSKLFFEADFTFISNGSMFNGFNVNRDSARHLGREDVRIYPYSFVWFGQWSGDWARRYSHYLANPDYTTNAIDNFYRRFKQLGGANMTFGSIGRSLNSDFDDEDTRSRFYVMENHKEILSGLTADGADIMIHGGNLYAIPYADIIIDVPESANHFNIVDESIPFYHIVFHGLVPYTGSPVNLAPDYERSILKAAETGAGLQFMFMKAPGESLQLTYYTNYFAADINRWKDEPVELYKRFNNELGHTVNQFITGHRTLSQGVTMTEYEDGTKVIVNYTSDAYDYEGTAVPARDFIVIR